MPASLRFAVGSALAAVVTAPAMAQMTIGWRLASSHGIAACQMVYDAARNRCVAVGEWPSLVQPFSTAEWNGTNWRARPLSTTPPSRSSFGLAYDAGHARVVLFGGELPPNGQALDDTWEYDGLDWIERSPAVRPPARKLPAMTRDLVRGRVLLAGGVGAGTSALVDTWTWNGTTWQNLSAPLPPLLQVAMTAHPPTQQVVLVGNRAGVGETWTFDGTTWTQAVAASTPFGANYRMTTDGANSRIVLLAAGSTTPWQWNGTAWSPFAAAFDGRRFCGLAADGAGRVLAFAGMRLLPNGLFPSLLPLSDTWQLADSGHVRLDSGGPIDVQAPKIAWDATRARLVCVGTASPTSMPNETWEYDGAAWQARTAPTPSPAIDACMCFDFLRGRTVRFGGGRVNFLSFLPTAELSEWDGTQWHVLPASGPPRMAHAMTYDLTRGCVLVFGGEGPSGLATDTWKWDGTNWTQLAVIGPPPRVRAGLAFDQFRSCAVLFGGQTSTLALLGDTWEWDGMTWRQIVPLTSPQPRQLPLFDYDPTRQRAVLMGGSGSSGGLHDAWEWDGINWQQVATSVPEILPSPAPTAVMAGDHWLLVSQGSTWFGHPAAARTSLVGTGCGGTSAPALRADCDPVLGGSAFAAELHHAAPNAPFLLGVGVGRANTPIGGGCTIYVPQLDAVRQGTAGTSGFAAVPLSVPPGPQLLGIEVSLQAAPRDTGAALGFALTNAVVARIGL